MAKVQDSKLQRILRLNHRNSLPEVFCKMVLLKFWKIYKKTPVPESFFLNNVAELRCNFIKNETLAKVLSCAFSKSLKNTLFYRTHLVAAFISNVKEQK